MALERDEVWILTQTAAPGPAHSPLAGSHFFSNLPQFAFPFNCLYTDFSDACLLHFPFSLISYELASTTTHCYLKGKGVANILQLEVELS